MMRTEYFSVGVYIPPLCKKDLGAEVSYLKNCFSELQCLRITGKDAYSYNSVGTLPLVVWWLLCHVGRVLSRKPVKQCQLTFMGPSLS